MIRVGAPRDMPVYFPAFAGTKLYCLVTEAVGCEQLAQGCCAAASRPGLEPATLRSQVRRPTTKPPRHPSSQGSCLWYRNRASGWVVHLGWPCMVLGPKFKVPLFRSFVPRPVEDTCRVSLTRPGGLEP